MRKPILSFVGPFDRAKAQRYVERSRREHNFGHPEPVEDGQLFRVSFEKGAKGPFQVYSHTSYDRYVLRRTAADARRTPGDEFAVSFVESGAMIVTQAGNTIPVEAGQMTLLSMNLPYTVEHLPSEEAPFKVIYTHIPGHAIDPNRRLNKGPMVVRSNEYDTIKRVLLLLLECGDELGIKTSKSLFTLMVNRLRHALNLSGRPQDSMSSDDKFDAVVQHIRHNFSNSLIDLRSTADSVGIAARTINYLTLRRGTSFSEILWDTRIGAVRSWLLNPEMAAISLQQIALAAGFKSAAHMSTKFKTKLNMSPLAFRKAANSGFEAQSLS